MGIFNRTYRYFISYRYQKTMNTYGYSNCVVTFEKKIKTIEEVDKIANGIGDKGDKGAVVILYFKKL